MLFVIVNAKIITFDSMGSILFFKKNSKSKFNHHVWTCTMTHLRGGHLIHVLSLTWIGSALYVWSLFYVSSLRQDGWASRSASMQQLLCSPNTSLSGKWFLWVSMVTGCGVSPCFFFPLLLKPQCCGGDRGCWDTWLCTCSVRCDLMSRSLDVCVSRYDEAFLYISWTSTDVQMRHYRDWGGGGGCEVTAGEWTPQCSLKEIFKIKDPFFYVNI